MKQTESFTPVFEPNEIMSILTWLTKKYTSNESSSVSYDTAKQLMEAVMYCIREYFKCNNSNLPLTNSLSCRNVYDLGYKKVLEKADACRHLYDDLIQDFQTYNCNNYSDTIIKGIPAFFLHYDPLFAPQETILTLDYPVLYLSKEMNQDTGVDRIYDYLILIQMEKKLLDFFDPDYVKQLLSRIQADYSQLYLDNICDVVFFVTLVEILLKKPVSHLSITMNELNQLEQLIGHSSITDIEYWLDSACKTLCKAMNNQFQAQESDSQEDNYYSYFHHALHDYAFRIYHGLQNHVLAQVLYVSDDIRI